MVIGVSLLEGGNVSLAAVVAIFVSNLPEGLSSSAGMKKAGRRAGYVFGVWGAIAVVSGIAAALGNLLLAGASPRSSPERQRSLPARSSRCWSTR